MEIQQLRAFVAAARRESFTAAAEDLFTTRAALSKSVAKLERELGAPLFERTRDGIALTAAGRRFLERAAPVVAGYDDLEAAAAGGHGRVGLTLGVPVTWTDAFMPAVERFCASHPAVDVSVGSFPDAECIRRAEAGGLDVVVSHLPIPGMADEGQPLASSPLVIAMAPGCPLAALDEVTEDDLAPYAICYYACGYDDLLWAPRIGGASESFCNDILYVYALVSRCEAVFPTPLRTVPSFVSGVVTRRFVGALDTTVMSGYISPAAKGDDRLKRACYALRDALVLDGAAGRAEPGRA